MKMSELDLRERRGEMSLLQLKIDFAGESDYGYLKDRDRHLPEQLILPKIKAKEIYLLRNEQEAAVGWMRYGYFWDNTPFMNLLWIDEPYRGKGAGRRVVHLWEEHMQQKGFKRVMTSTQANEEAQHFYRRLGYQDAGCLLLENEPLEIMMTKTLG